MPLTFIKRRKTDFKRLKNIKWFNVSNIILAALPTIVFGVFTIVFTLKQDASARATREQDQRQADEINRRTIFKEYIDDMTELLLDRDHDVNITKILLHIRVQTLTVLQNLDVNRKRDVIVFLYENRLLRSDEFPNVHLHGANLSGMKFWSSSTVACLLPFLYLPGTYLENVIFDGCLLTDAVFVNASLSAAKFLRCSIANTKFMNSNLTGAQFQGNELYNTDFSGSHLVQSSITGGTFLRVNLTNADLYQSKISDELLHPSKNVDKRYNSFLQTRLPNGSFTYTNRKNLIVNNGNTSQCHLNIQLSQTDIFNSSLLIETNVTQVSEVDMSTIDKDCFCLTEDKMAVREVIDVQQFSLLIDLGKAMFNLSAFIEFKYPNDNNEFSIIVQFAQDRRVADEERSLTISKKNVSLFQFEFLVNSIPEKTRSLAVILSCNITSGIGQLCTFDHVKLNIFEKLLSRSELFNIATKATHQILKIYLLVCLFFIYKIL